MGHRQLRAVDDGFDWAHLITQTVCAAAGTHAYADTHGDCNITNCIGSPRDRVSFAATWEYAAFSVGLNVNYLGPMSNREEQGAGCATTTVSGGDLSSDCKIKSFTTADL